MASTPPPVPLPAPSVISVSLPFLPSLSALPSSSSSAQPFPTTSTQSSDSLLPFKAVYVIPVVAVVGVVFIIAFIWLVQGCCTRKPRVIEEDPEFYGGPRYEFIESEKKQGDDPYHHYEAVEAPHLGYEQVAWAEHTAYHQPVAHLHPAAVDHRARRSRSTHGVSLIPTPSDATSAALLDMYESDTDKDDERRRQEPWEALRHRSIRRGILETVQKEEGWMNSLRAVAGSPFVNQAPITEAKPESRFRRSESEAWIEQVMQRRAESSRSKASTTAITANHTYVDVSSPWTEETGFKIIQESPPSTPTRAALRGGDPQARPKKHARAKRGKTGTRDYFNYKMPPVGATSVPMDQTIGVRVGAKEPTRISMLPLSPPRIMSPPLENQLLFTPNPNSMTDLSSGSADASWAHGFGNPPGNTLLSRLTERKGKGKTAGAATRRKASPDVTRVNKPLPYPIEEVVAPLRTGRRAAKLVKTRGAASGKYQAVPGRSGNDSGRVGER